jgi:hypothetical protein
VTLTTNLRTGRGKTKGPATFVGQHLGVGAIWQLRHGTDVSVSNQNEG